MSLDKLNPALLRTDGAADGDALVFSAANARLEFKTAISASDFAANDYSTYTTLQSEYRANDAATLLSAQSNDFITYTTLLGRLDIVQDNVAAASGGGGGSVVWSRKTANYTAISGDAVIADTTAAPFTITLPPTPTLGATLIIADGGNWAINNLTVARNSSTIENIAQDYLLTTGNIKVDFIYDGTTWQVYTSAGGQTLTEEDVNVLAASMAIALG